MNVEIGNYKGFAFVINNVNGSLSYEWKGAKYLRFYEM